MRKFTRLPSPQCLQDNAVQWTKNFVEGADFYLPKKCRKKVIDKFENMTQGNCAYCDGPVGSESHESIDHFRPKSKYPDLVYDWENLYPACDICQGSKVNRFDERLLRPDAPDYHFLRYFVANFKEGTIEVLLSASLTDQERADYSIKIFNLNKTARKIRRKRERDLFNQNKNINYYYRYFLEDLCDDSVPGTEDALPKRPSDSVSGQTSTLDIG